jgi:hypothetical protein
VAAEDEEDDEEEEEEEEEDVSVANTDEPFLRLKYLI